VESLSALLNEALNKRGSIRLKNRIDLIEQGIYLNVLYLGLWQLLLNGLFLLAARLCKFLT